MFEPVMIVRLTEAGGRDRMNPSAVGRLFPVKARTVRPSTRELIVHVYDGAGAVWTLGPEHYVVVQQGADR
jgi:hypothetical protein